MLRVGSTPADILAGQGAEVAANLRHDSTGALAAGPFFAPVIVHFATKTGHLLADTTDTTANLVADTRWPAGQPRPQRICASADHQTVCLHFGPHPTVSLRVTKTAVPDPGVAGQPITYTITVTNEGPADAFGVTVDDDLTPVLAGFTWTCTASAPPSRCARASGSGSIATTAVDIAVGGTVTFRVTGVLPAGSAGTANNTVTRHPPGGHRRLRLHAWLLRHRDRLLRTRPAPHRTCRMPHRRTGLIALAAVPCWLCSQDGAYAAGLVARGRLRRRRPQPPGEIAYQIWDRCGRGAAQPGQGAATSL